MTLSGFDAQSREALQGCYPEQSTRLHHGLAGHPLLQPEALIDLAHRIAAEDILCFRGDIPIDPGTDGAPPTGLSPEDTIRNITTNKSWMVLKKVEQGPEFEALLRGLLAEMDDVVVPKTGPMLNREAFIFVSSPGSVTPFHLDPEHNILMQLTGTKTMTVFPQANERLVSSEAHEEFHQSGKYNLAWQADFAALGTPYALKPGDALYVPVKAPHWVKNGDEPSISLSVTWRSDWSYNEQYARQFNAMIRQLGITPAPPKRFPHRNLVKSLAWRSVDKARRTIGRTS